MHIKVAFRTFDHVRNKMFTDFLSNVFPFTHTDGSGERPETTGKGEMEKPPPVSGWPTTTSRHVSRRALDVTAFARP